MAAARELKSRIRAARNISKITHAMEAVAASKMKKAQETATSGRAYERLMRGMTERLLTLSSVNDHPLLRQTSTDRFSTLTVILSTDRGLCGSLNTNTFRLVERSITDQSFVFPVGKKASRYATWAGWNLIGDIASIPDRPSFEDTLPISTIILEEFLSERVSSVFLGYPKFVSTLVQEPTFDQLLPFHRVTLVSGEMILRPKYLFEPGSRELLDDLLPSYIRLVLYQAVLSMKAAEQSARMVAMKNASDNAEAVRLQLQMQYNQHRQRSITSEIADIVTAGLTIG